MTDQFARAPTAPILEVVLDRPKANAIDAATSRILGATFAQFRDDPALRVAIITGGRREVFLAGWDLVASAGGEPADADYGVGGFGGIQELPHLNKPIIAAVNGMAVGGGFELALSADLIIAAEHARFALPEITAGTLAGSVQRSGCRGASPITSPWNCCSLGRWMDAREAHARGIVNEVVAATDLMPRARTIATVLANGPPLVFAAIKEVGRESETMSFLDAMAHIRDRRFPTVAALYSSDDQREGARAFADKRAPVWRGR